MTAASTRARCGSDEDYQPSVLPTDSAEDPLKATPAAVEPIGASQFLLLLNGGIGVDEVDALHTSSARPIAPVARGTRQRRLFFPHGIARSTTFSRARVVCPGTVLPSNIRRASRRISLSLAGR